MSADWLRLVIEHWFEVWIGSWVRLVGGEAIGLALVCDE